VASGEVFGIRDSGKQAFLGGCFDKVGQVCDREQQHHIDVGSQARPTQQAGRDAADYHSAFIESSKQALD
jgi:hypothetical protein